jgi:hypothetical protein
VREEANGSQTKTPKHPSRGTTSANGTGAGTSNLPAPLRQDLNRMGMAAVTQQGSIPCGGTRAPRVGAEARSEEP